MRLFLSIIFFLCVIIVINYSYAKTDIKQTITLKQQNSTKNSKKNTQQKKTIGIPADTTFQGC